MVPSPSETELFPGAQQNQGDGNRTAARRYDRKSTDFAKSGRAKDQPEAAESAREGAEWKELGEAEKVGRSTAKDEDHEVKR